MLLVALFCCFISKNVWQMSVLRRAAGLSVSHSTLRTYDAHACMLSSHSSHVCPCLPTHHMSAHHRLLPDAPETFDDKHRGDADCSVWWSQIRPFSFSVQRGEAFKRNVPALNEHRRKGLTFFSLFSCVNLELKRLCPHKNALNGAEMATNWLRGSWRMPSSS